MAGSPLVSRPPYGEKPGNPALPHSAESRLPEGGPSNRGLPLDSGIPGSKTFAQPPDNHREPNVKDESPWRVEDADSLLKDRGRVDVNEDNADKHNEPGSYGLGPSDSANPKTKYPYRDNKPNEKNAAQRVVSRYLRRLG